MQDLAPNQVVSWLRSHARRLNGIADDIERAFAQVQGLNRTEQPLFQNACSPTIAGLPDVSEIKAFIGDKAKRIATISKHFGDIQPGLLETIITEQNGFVRGKQGWITVQKQEADE